MEIAHLAINYFQVNPLHTRGVPVPFFFADSYLPLVADADTDAESYLLLVADADSTLYTVYTRVMSDPV